MSAREGFGLCSSFCLCTVLGCYNNHARNSICDCTRLPEDDANCTCNSYLGTLQTFENLERPAIQASADPWPERSLHNAARLACSSCRRLAPAFLTSLITSLPITYLSTSSFLVFIKLNSSVSKVLITRYQSCVHLKFVIISVRTGI